MGLCVLYEIIWVALKKNAKEVKEDIRHGVA